MKSVVWCIVRYSAYYGDSPEEIWSTRAKAQARVRELNEPWFEAFLKHRMPYKLRRCIVHT